MCSLANIYTIMDCQCGLAKKCENVMPLFGNTWSYFNLFLKAHKSTGYLAHLWNENWNENESRPKKKTRTLFVAHFENHKLDELRHYFSFWLMIENIQYQWRIYIVKFWTRAPPGGPNSFNFMQFLGNLAKSYVGAPPWGVGAPSSGKS